MLYRCVTLRTEKLYKYATHPNNEVCVEIRTGLSAVQVSKELASMSSSDSYSVTKDKKFNPNSQKFGRFGLMCKLEDGTETKDARELFRDLSPAATWLIWEMDMLKNVMTNEVYMRPTTMSAGDKAKYYRGIKELEQENIVRKIRRGTYFINPYVLFPWNEFLEEVRERWKDLSTSEE